MSTTEKRKSDDVDADGDEVKADEDDAAGDTKTSGTASVFVVRSKRGSAEDEGEKSSRRGSKVSDTQESGKQRETQKNSSAGETTTKQSSADKGAGSKSDTADKGTKSKSDTADKGSKSKSGSADKGSKSKSGSAGKKTGSKADAADKTSFSTGESIVVRESETKSAKTKTISETQTAGPKSPRASTYSDVEDYQNSPRSSDARPSQFDTDARKSEATKEKSRQPRRYSAKSAEPQSMIVGRIRKAGPDAYAENRRRIMLGESAGETLSQDGDTRQHMAPLSLHTMAELNEKPQSYPPTTSTSIRAKQALPKSFASKMASDEVRLGGTRMSTLTDFLRRKQMGSRMRAMSREMQALRDQVHPDGRPTLYEEYTKLTEQRIYDISQHFTPEQMMEYRDAFYNFDDDLDGFIPIGEVPYLMRALCENPTEEELYEWISEVDIDALGSIDFADFMTVMYKKREFNPIGFDEVFAAFKVFDNHNNGLLCAKELVYLMTTFGETLSEEEMEDMLREVNINDDYEVPYVEFVKRMTEC